MADIADGAHAGGSGDFRPIHADGRRAHVALPAILLGLLVLGILSFVAGELRPRPLPTCGASTLRVSGLVAVGVSLATLASWGAYAACTHVSAKLSRWLDGARPAVADMSLFAAAYLVATSQRRGSHPSDDGGGLRGSTAPPPPQPFGLRDGRGRRLGGDCSGTAAGSWRRAAGVVFTPEWARTSGGGRGGVGPREVDMSARRHRENGKKVVPSSP